LGHHCPSNHRVRTKPENTVTERIPLAVPDLRGNESAYLARCVQDNWVSSAGPFVVECEKQIAALAGRAHAVASVNGTTALQLSMTAAGVKRGDYVVVPDWTFAATANAAHHAGATPIFADVTEESWSLDAAILEAILEDPPGRIGAVVAVHALGHPADIDSLLPLCRRAGVPLIEDAAGAMGDLAIFSFNGNKTVTAGGGGMVVTDNEDQAKHLRALSAQARSGAEYRYDAIGFNYRMTNLNAGVLLAQIERLEEMVAAKRRITKTYDRALAGRNDLRRARPGRRAPAGSIPSAVAARARRSRSCVTWPSTTSRRGPSGARCPTRCPMPTRRAA
jgi:perosamine synthetase